MENASREDDLPGNCVFLDTFCVWISRSLTSGNDKMFSRHFLNLPSLVRRLETQLMEVLTLDLCIAFLPFVYLLTTPQSMKLNFMVRDRILH